MTAKIYAPQYQRDVASYPHNTHLAWENSDHTYIYYVDSVNNKVLKKLKVSDGTITTVETRTNANIARGFHDWATNEIYFIDCDYDGGTSYVWKIDLSDDTITELTTKEGDIFDIWRYDSETYILYFENSGYTLETDTIAPDGDVVTNWSSTGANHYTEIDEGTPPNTTDYINASVTGTTDTFTMGDLDLSAYDSYDGGAGEQVYQITCYVYWKGMSSVINYLQVSGNQTGMTEEAVVNFNYNTWQWSVITWSGLSLTNAELNNLQITIKHFIQNGYQNYVASVYCVVYFYGNVANASVVIEDVDTSEVYSNIMGAVAGRSWYISQICVVGDQFWFLWKWSDENVEIWNYDISLAAWGNAGTEWEDCGANTELSSIQQGAISYDGSDVLFFVLGTGTKEVSTIVADVANNIDNNDYILISSIERNATTGAYQEKDYHIWFNKDAGGSDPTITANGIEVAITTGQTAQQVSDAITAAVDACVLFDAANGSGTLTTVTITCHHCGNTTNIADGNSGLSYATATPGVNNTYYLYSYEITDDTLTQRGAFNVALMLDRNTYSSHDKPFNLERGFSVSVMKEYQIAANSGRLNYTAYLEDVRATTDSCSIIATTDYFLWINNNGTYELWMREDLIGDIDYVGASQHPILYYGGIPRMDIFAICKSIAATNEFTIAKFWTKGIFIQFIDTYTHNGSSTATQVVFEGIIYTHDLITTPNRKFSIINRAEYELMNTYPNISDYTNYTGKTSGEIIDQLIDDFCEYIIPGTIVNGSTTWTCPADWEAKGDKNLFTVIKELSEVEGFLATLRPTGALDFNDGTVDTGVTISSTSQYWDVKAKPVAEIINQVRIWGGYVSGSKIGPATVNDIASQDEIGIHKWEKTYASVLDATILSTLATAKLSLIGGAPLLVWISLRDTNSVFLQPGEYLTIGASVHIDNSDVDVTAGTYIILNIHYYPKEGYINLLLSDGLYFEDNPQETLPQQNAQLIQQIADFTTEIEDATAIHDDESGEIAAIAEKAVPVAADMAVIEDSASGNAKKMAQVGNLAKALALADLLTKSHTSLTDIGANTHAQIDTHISNTTTAHGAVSAATPSKHVVRDAAGRAKFVASAAAGDAVIHEQLHAEQHAMDDAAEHTSSDVATLNASTSKHGFLKKLDNDPTHFMDGQGNWSVPAGGGGATEMYLPTTYQAPENGYTAGDNNVYWYIGVNGNIAFGKSAKTAGNLYLAIFSIPENYDEGEDLTLYISTWMSNVNADIIDYSIITYYRRSGIGWTVADTDAGTINHGASWATTWTTITITGTNIQAGDELAIPFKMEDDNNAVLSFLNTFRLKIPLA